MTKQQREYFRLKYHEAKAKGIILVNFRIPKELKEVYSDFNKKQLRQWRSKQAALNASETHTTK